MAAAAIEKLLALPSTLTPNTLYLVKDPAEDGFEFYVSDNTGNAAEKLKTGFLSPPDENSEDDTTHYYMGWVLVGGGWLIRRQLWADSSATDAVEVINPTYTTFAAAWAARLSLIYA